MDAYRDAACPFKGTFDGGNQPSAVLLSRGAVHTGAFRLHQRAVIKDLTVSGSVSGGDYVGGVVALVTGAASELAM